MSFVTAIAIIAAIGSVYAVGITSAGASSTNRVLGSLSNVALNRPIVGIAPTRSGKGYWLVASDGGVFTFGDAHYHGSTGGRALAAPIVDIAPTASGHGYWLVASDGGVFTFGDARFYGSTGGRRLSARIVGMAATPSGRGYWLASADGHVYSFGNAADLGATGPSSLSASIVGIAPTRSGHGYWLASRDGGVFTFGDARFYGSASGESLASPVVGVSAAATGFGYWLETSVGTTYTFGHAHSFATKFPAVPSGSRGSIVTIAASPRGGFWVASRTGNVGVSTLNSPTAKAPVKRAPTTSKPTKAQTTRTLSPVAKRQALIAFQLVIRMNAERVARHLAPFGWDGLLAQRANSWARTLMTTNTFHHQSLGAIANASNGRFEEVGENIYYGTGAADDAGTAHVSLMHSAEHRVNMLLPQGQLVGIGAACRGDVLVVVEDFAIKMGAPLPAGTPPMPPVDPIVATNPNGAHC